MKRPIGLSVPPVKSVAYPDNYAAHGLTAATEQQLETWRAYVQSLVDLFPQDPTRPYWLNRVDQLTAEQARRRARAAGASGPADTCHGDR